MIDLTESVSSENLRLIRAEALRVAAMLVWANPTFDPGSLLAIMGDDPNSLDSAFNGFLDPGTGRNPKVVDAPTPPDLERVRSAAFAAGYSTGWDHAVQDYSGVAAVTAEDEYAAVAQYVAANRGAV